MKSAQPGGEPAISERIAAAFKPVRKLERLKIAMNVPAVRVAALVLLAGIGLYFSLVVPALTMRWLSLPVGLVFLIAAVVLLVDILRRRRNSSSRTDANS